MQARKHIPKKARATGKTKVFTEEEDADENGRIAVILRIVQHHCVTKIIGFDVIMVTSAATVTAPQQQYSTSEVKNKKRALFNRQCQCQCLPTLIPTKGQQHEPR